jgi:hypothetical protein
MTWPWSRSLGPKWRNHQPIILESDVHIPMLFWAEAPTCCTWKWKKVLNSIPINLTTPELLKTTAWTWLQNEKMHGTNLIFLNSRSTHPIFGTLFSQPYPSMFIVQPFHFSDVLLARIFLAPTSDACWDGTLNMAEVAPMVQKWVQAFLLKSSIGQHMAMGSPAIQCKTQLLSPLCPEVPFEAVLRSSSIGWCQWIGFAVERTKNVEPSSGLMVPSFYHPSEW